jgi:hypothetical protein
MDRGGIPWRRFNENGMSLNVRVVKTMSDGKAVGKWKFFNGRTPNTLKWLQKVNLLIINYLSLFIGRLIRWPDTSSSLNKLVLLEFHLIRFVLLNKNQEYPNFRRWSPLKSILL